MKRASLFIGLLSSGLVCFAGTHVMQGDTIDSLTVTSYLSFPNLSENPGTALLQNNATPGAGNDFTFTADTIEFSALANGYNFGFVLADGGGNLTPFDLYNSSPVITSKMTVSSFSVTSGGSANQTVCWKSATTLGFCTSVVGIGGSCTCQ